MERKSGVLLHISSLPGDFSCGGFSEEAKNFIDFLSDSGFSYWQTLPFCPIDECGSPYKSHSAFAGNIFFIDLERLFEKGLITKEELDKSRQDTPYSCEFERLFSEREKLLLAASKRVDGDERKKIDDFIENSPYIKKYCEFTALKTANNEKTWQEWETNEINPEILFMHRFSQYEFFSEWKMIKDYANEKGIKIIGDVPIYVAPDSADTWGDKKQFLLDEKGYPSVVAGVPPDYFSADGQLWGNPIYDFSAMEKDGFKWWTDRMKHVLNMFDGVRIDHFRAFESFWAVPKDAKTAKEGKWVKGPGMELINKFRDVSQDRLIIAEDLGIITKEVEKLVKDSGFPGMRVFQFGFLSDDDSVHKPHNYINNTVAYSGTHDNNTLLGYLWELGEAQRKNMLEYCGYTDSDWEKGYESIIRTILRSVAGLVILPVQDILKFGSDTRLNTPGTSENNWRYRVTRQQLSGIDRNYWKKLNELYKRI